MSSAHTTVSPGVAPASRAPALVAAAAILGLAWIYAVLVPAGLPYDEPSHWQNVLHIAADGSLPVVGDPDVSYEAVQGPVAYVVDSGLLVVSEALGLNRADAFVAVRMAQSTWLVGLFFVIAALVRRALPDASPQVAVLGGFVAVGSPVLVAVGSSVQNDVPALTLALAALLLFLGDPRSVARSAGVGALLGLAFLAKASVWPLGIVLVVVMAARRDWRRLSIFVLSGLAVSGWWIARNVAEYGSLTGNNAVRESGTEFPPIGFSGPSTVIELARSAVTFLWLPVEYWRNVIDAPSVVDALIVVATALVVGLGVWGLRHRRSPDLMVLAAVAVLSIVAWAVVNTAVTNASFRLAYLSLPIWAVLVGVTSGRVPGGRWIAAGLVVALHVWVLVSLGDVDFAAMVP